MKGKRKTRPRKALPANGLPRLHITMPCLILVIPQPFLICQYLTEIFIIFFITPSRFIPTTLFPLPTPCNRKRPETRFLSLKSLKYIIYILITDTHRFSATLLGSRSYRSCRPLLPATTPARGRYCPPSHVLPVCYCYYMVHTCRYQCPT